jgi:hypothetical protein
MFSGFIFALTGAGRELANVTRAPIDDEYIVAFCEAAERMGYLIEMREDASPGEHSSTAPGQPSADSLRATAVNTVNSIVDKVGVETKS